MRHPPLPMKLRARHWNASLRQMRSFRTELVMSRMNSSLCDVAAAMSSMPDSRELLKC